jgi:hypothetical protein
MGRCIEIVDAAHAMPLRIDILQIFGIIAARGLEEPARPPFSPPHRIYGD